MTLNKDFRDMLCIFLEEKVEFLIIGAYALAAHGLPRATGGIDFWVMPSPENASAVIRALTKFGAPLQKISAGDFEAEGTIFQIGVPPRRIDIVTEVTGLKFAEAFAASDVLDFAGFVVRVPCVKDLITNKKATGRPKDLIDVEVLERFALGES